MSSAAPIAHLSFTKILELTPKRIVYLLTQGLARVKTITNAPSHNPQVVLLKIPTAFPISFIFLYVEYSANGMFRFMMMSVRPSTRTPAYQNSMRRSSLRHAYRQETLWAVLVLIWFIIDLGKYLPPPNQPQTLQNMPSAWKLLMMGTSFLGCS